MNDKLLNQDINYLQGQIYGLKAVMLGLAGLLVDQDSFRAEGLERLRLCRDTVLAEPVADSTLLGVDAIETWLRHATG